MKKTFVSCFLIISALFLNSCEKESKLSEADTNDANVTNELIAKFNTDPILFSRLKEIQKIDDQGKSSIEFSNLLNDLVKSNPKLGELTEEQTTKVFENSVFANFGSFNAEVGSVENEETKESSIAKNKRIAARFDPNCYSGRHSCCSVIGGNLASRCFKWYCPYVPERFLCFR